jgi:hypothetical protein
MIFCAFIYIRNFSDTIGNCDSGFVHNFCLILGLVRVSLLFIHGVFGFARHGKDIAHSHSLCITLIPHNKPLLTIEDYSTLAASCEGAMAVISCVYCDIWEQYYSLVDNSNQ